MNRLIRRRRVLQAGLALCVPWALPGARAHEIITSTLRVTHPWSRATIEGDAFAVLCMKFDEVAEADRLILVQTPVAQKAELVGAGASPNVDFPIPAGKDTYLSDHPSDPKSNQDSGTYVRLSGLKRPLEVGRSYRLVLGFEKGGTYTTTFSVDFTRPDESAATSLSSSVRPPLNCRELQRLALGAEVPNHPGAASLVQRIMECARLVTNP